MGKETESIPLAAATLVGGDPLQLPGVAAPAGVEEPEHRLIGIEELEKIVRQRGHRLFCRALRICRNVADAEDLVQVTFLRLIEKWKKTSFKDTDHVRNWAMTVLTHCAIDQLRAMKRRVRLYPSEACVSEEEAPSHLAPPDTAPDLAAVLAFVETLPEELTQAWCWFELLGLTLPEIAEITGAPLGTETSRLRRAREAIDGEFKKLAAARPRRAVSGFNQLGPPSGVRHPDGEPAGVESSLTERAKDGE